MNTIVSGPAVTIGVITQFNPKSKFGIVLTEDGRASFALNTQTGPKRVIVGTFAPAFNGKFADALPGPGDMIVFITAKSPDGKTRVTHWGYAQEWQDAEKLIAGRMQTLGARSANFIRKFSQVALQSIQHNKPVGAPKKQNPKKLTTVIFTNHCTVN